MCVEGGRWGGWVWVWVWRWVWRWVGMRGWVGKGREGGREGVVCVCVLDMTAKTIVLTHPRFHLGRFTRYVRRSSCISRNSSQNRIVRGSSQHVRIRECLHPLKFPDGSCPHDAPVLPHHDILLRASLLPEKMLWNQRSPIKEPHNFPDTPNITAVVTARTCSCHRSFLCLCLWGILLTDVPCRQTSSRSSVSLHGLVTPFAQWLHWP